MTKFLLLVATSLLIGCSQETTPTTNNDAKQILASRMAWIEKNIWTEDVKWERDGNGLRVDFILWNRSEGTLNNIVIYMTFSDSNGRVIGSTLSSSLQPVYCGPYSSYLMPSDNLGRARPTTLGPGEHRSVTYVLSGGELKFPVDAAAHANFSIVGVGMDGVTLPGD